MDSLKSFASEFWLPETADPKPDQKCTKTANHNKNGQKLQTPFCVCVLQTFSHLNLGGEGNYSSREGVQKKALISEFWESNVKI